MATTTRKQNKIEKKEAPLTAVSYIKSSSLFSESKNEWILPLVNKVLGDEPLNEKIIKSVALGDTGGEEKEEKNTVEIKKGLRYEIVQQDVQKITEISSIKNIGLLDIDSSLKIERGLNIFFGKNGAGKSSIYLGLCKLFGKNKNVLPDLEKVDSDSECKIKFKNKDGEEADLAWKTGESKVESPVMIFDGEISQVLVEQDQNNKFEIAHLKLEYFSYLRELYTKIESIVSDNITEKEKAISDTETALSSLFPSLPETSTDDIERNIATPLTRKEKTDLSACIKQRETLEKDNSDATLRNLNTAKDTILNNILTRFGKKDESGIWVFSYNKAGIASINKHIEDIQKAQKAFEESGVQKIKSLIPDSWISDDIWTEFIDKSIEFLESLEEESQNKYKNEICIYCQQPLSTPESKKLVSAYSELRSEIESKLKSEKIALIGVGNIINTCIQNLKSITSTNQVIEAEFEALGRDKEEKISIDTTALTPSFEVLKNNIDNIKTINLSDEEEKLLVEFYEIYRGLYTEFETKSSELKKAIGDKKEALSKLQEKVSPLEVRDNTEKNKVALEKYVSNKKELEKIKARLSDIHTLKQTLSRTESEFAKVAGLQEFQKQLEKEYASLKFTTPSYWKLGTITRDGINKRTYSLNDKRLSDIFSEGERKLHSLADFFAQCETNKYKGIYIFDDPVNSLDEANIVNVAKRILKLVEDGNQVIVFTHNLYFLNALDKDSNKSVYKLSKMPTKKQIIIESTKLDTTSSLKTSMTAIDNEMKTMEKAESTSTIQIGGVYDLMSGYIEDYVEKKLLNNVVSRYRAHIRMTSLSALSEMSSEKIKTITELYENASRGGNRHSNPTDTPEPTYSQLQTDYKSLKENCDYTK